MKVVIVLVSTAMLESATAKKSNLLFCLVVGTQSFFLSWGAGVEENVPTTMAKLPAVVSGRRQRVGKNKRDLKTMGQIVLFCCHYFVFFAVGGFFPMYTNTYRASTVHSSKMLSAKVEILKSCTL